MAATGPSSPDTPKETTAAAGTSSGAAEMIKSDGMTTAMSQPTTNPANEKKSHAPLHNPTPAPPTFLNKNGGTSVGKNNEMNIITSRSSSSSPTCALEDLFKSSSTNEEESKVWHCVYSYSYLLLLHTRI